LKINVAQNAPGASSRKLRRLSSAESMIGCLSLTRMKPGQSANRRLLARNCTGF
jgi:hypothetical protein